MSEIPKNNRCGICGEWFHNAHMCASSLNTLVAGPTNNPEVIIGRLKKRIAKLQQQRDGYHKQLEHYKVVVGGDWRIEHRYKKYQARIDETKRVRALEARVKEQEELIKLLKKNQ